MEGGSGGAITSLALFVCCLHVRYEFKRLCLGFRESIHFFNFIPSPIFKFTTFCFSSMLCRPQNNVISFKWEEVN